MSVLFTRTVHEILNVDYKLKFMKNPMTSFFSQKITLGNKRFNSGEEVKTEVHVSFVSKNPEFVFSGMNLSVECWQKVVDY